MISETCSVTVPSSVLTGLASLVWRTLTFQPAGTCVLASTKPGGTCTSTLTVRALSCSLGTRTSMVGLDPAGRVLGWMLTWAWAAAGSSRAPAATAMMVRLIDASCEGNGGPINGTAGAGRGRPCRWPAARPR